LPGEGLQNLGRCLALKVFEQGGIFIVPHLLWHGPWFSHPKDSSIQSPLMTHKEMLRIYSNPHSHRSILLSKYVTISISLFSKIYCYFTFVCNCLAFVLIMITDVGGDKIPPVRRMRDGQDY
jgi:hypothetical protein